MTCLIFKFLYDEFIALHGEACKQFTISLCDVDFSILDSRLGSDHRTILSLHILLVNSIIDVVKQGQQKSMIRTRSARNKDIHLRNDGF